MVYDAKSSGFRGYAFIYYTKTSDATAALRVTNGIEVKERRIRVDYSKTKRAHTPTPGFYRGKRGNRSFDRQRPRRDIVQRRPLSPPRRREDFKRHRSRERLPVRDLNRDRERELRYRRDIHSRSPRRESYRERRNRS